MFPVGPDREGELLSSLTLAERRWSLTAAISCATVFGVGIGAAAPLLSLILEARGTDIAVTGINAASTFVGVILGPILTPRLVYRFGIRPFVLACLAIDAILFLSLKVFDSIAAWFVLRCMLGFVGSGVFTATEAWINILAGDGARGRIIGVYAAALYFGFGIGPLILIFTGTAGWAPFLAGAAIALVAMLPLIGVSDLARNLGRGRRVSLFVVAAKAPVLVLTIGLVGLFETATLSLLPIWATRLGLDMRLAAATLSAVYVGSIALQVPIGWLSDRGDRMTMLQLCSVAGLFGALVIPLVPAAGPALFAVLFLWGGCASGLYPIALSMAGERFQDGELVTANAALIMSYGLGSLAGPVLGGLAMDLWNPQGLLCLFVLLFAALVAITRWRRH